MIRITITHVRDHPDGSITETIEDEYLGLIEDLAGRLRKCRAALALDTPPADDEPVSPALDRRLAELSASGPAKAADGVDSYGQAERAKPCSGNRVETDAPRSPATCPAATRPSVAANTSSAASRRTATSGRPASQCYLRNAEMRTRADGRDRRRRRIKVYRIVLPRKRSSE